MALARSIASSSASLKVRLRLRTFLNSSAAVIVDRGHRARRITSLNDSPGKRRADRSASYASTRTEIVLVIHREYTARVPEGSAAIRPLAPSL
jgi:hypothetical protein